MTGGESIYAVVEYIDRTGRGWIPTIASMLPGVASYCAAQYGFEVLGLHAHLGTQLAGVVLIGEQVWDDQSVHTDATLRLLKELRGQSFTGKVVYLTDLRITNEAKAPFMAAYPGLVIVRKTEVIQGNAPLPL